MAEADYYSCDRCGCKTFYDVELDYNNANASITRKLWPNGNVGFMLVLCKGCTEELNGAKHLWHVLRNSLDVGWDRENSNG